MVPTRQALRVIALAALASPQRKAVADTLCAELKVTFPDELDDFVAKDVFPFLPPDVEACFRTTDFLYDFRPFFSAARHLGIEEYVCIGERGPTHNIPATILSWRENKSIRIFLETCLLCGIDHATIAEDLRGLYAVDVKVEDIATFAFLFVDADHTKGEAWLLYMKCIGDEEAKFKRSLLMESKDFVRWSLGVPVSMNSERALDRLISDAYYTIRLIKNRAGDHGVALAKPEQERVKMETEVIFKGLDRRVKLKELERASGEGKDSTDAAQEIKKIVIELDTHSFPARAELCK